MFDSLYKKTKKILKKIKFIVDMIQESCKMQNTKAMRE